MRLFLAAELDPVLRSRIGDVQQSLAREGVRDIRWSDPGGIHLTLRFCGEVPGDSVDRLRRVVAPGAPYPPFSVRVGGLGTFPPRGAPRVLFLAVRDSGTMAPLAAWAEEQVVSAGLPREPRPFHPHLTLGRFRQGARPVSPDLLEADFAKDVGVLFVDRIVLFESRLGPGGARYETLQAGPLLGVESP